MAGQPGIAAGLRNDLVKAQVQFAEAAGVPHRRRALSVQHAAQRRQFGARSCARRRGGRPDFPAPCAARTVPGRRDSSSRATSTPRRDCSTARPSPTSSSTASRTGERLTPSWRASSGTLRRDPGGEFSGQDRGTKLIAHHVHDTGAGNRLNRGRPPFSRQASTCDRLPHEEFLITESVTCRRQDCKRVRLSWRARLDLSPFALQTVGQTFQKPTGNACPSRGTTSLHPACAGKVVPDRIFGGHRNMTIMTLEAQHDHSPAYTASLGAARGETVRLGLRTTLPVQSVTLRFVRVGEIELTGAQEITGHGRRGALVRGRTAHPRRAGALRLATEPAGRSSESDGAGPAPHPPGLSQLVSVSRRVRGPRVGLEVRLLPDLSGPLPQRRPGQ